MSGISHECSVSDLLLTSSCWVIISTGQKSDCLVVRCLWSPLYHVSANTLTAQLMCFTERALGNMTSPTVSIIFSQYVFHMQW